MRLLLFDIDGTLLTLPGAGMRALGRAVRALMGFDFEGSDVKPDGRTDPLIVMELLRYRGVPLSHFQQVEAQIWELYAQYLVEEVKILPERRLAPGIGELLPVLHEDSRFRLGLLTGNLERTARIKLEVFGIQDYFPIGAFGSDCADRCRLGRVALERARRHWNHDFKPESTWIIGDTERDIQAARAFGARVLAVGTGPYAVERLQEFCPDVAMPDLANIEEVVRVLAG